MIKGWKKAAPSCLDDLFIINYVSIYFNVITYVYDTIEKYLNGFIFLHG